MAKERKQRQARRGQETLPEPRTQFSHARDNLSVGKWVSAEENREKTEFGEVKTQLSLEPELSWESWKQIVFGRQGI